MGNKLSAYGYTDISDKRVNLELSPNEMQAIIRALSFSNHVERHIALDIIGKLNRTAEEQL